VNTHEYELALSIIDVGPSAPPIIPIEEADLSVLI
jgi:hypothetical protein